MYTKQWPAMLGQLLQSGLQPEVAQNLSKALNPIGQCDQELEHRGPVLLESSYPNAPNFPLNSDVVGSVDNAIAPLIVNNPFSYMDFDNNVHNGFAAFFNGIVNINGGLVVRNFFGGVGGRGPGGENGYPGGTITIINPYTGESSSLTSIHAAITTSTVTARSGTTMGSGPANRRPMSAGALTSFVESITVLNLRSFSIPTDTYILVGKIRNGATSDAYIILEVDMQYPTPCISHRNNADQSITVNTETTVTIGTEIHKYPNDTTVFEHSSSEITIKQSGIYCFSYIIPWQSVAADHYGQAWLEEGGTKISSSVHAWNSPLNSTECDCLAATINHKVDVSGGNKTYRVRFIYAAGGNLSIRGGDDTYNGGFARLDIHRLRGL